MCLVCRVCYAGHASSPSSPTDFSHFLREMNEAVTAWLFSATDVMSFWAVTQSRNKGAVAILRRLGGRLTENAHMGQPGLLRFDVDRPAWEKARAEMQDE